MEKKFRFSCDNEKATSRALQKPCDRLEVVAEPSNLGTFSAYCSTLLRVFLILFSVNNWKKYFLPEETFPASLG